MRLMPALLAALACSSIAHAQDRATAADAAPVPVSISAQDPAPAIPASQAATSTESARSTRKARVTWEQRFTKANTTRDGHLTLEQAKAGYASIARHFAEIDVGKKGFVTEDDVRAWHKARRAVHRGPSANRSTG